MNTSGSLKQHLFKYWMFTAAAAVCILGFRTPINVAGNSSEYLTTGYVDPWEHFTRLQEIRFEKERLDEWLRKNTVEPIVPSSAVVVILGDKVVFHSAIRSSSQRLYSVASFTKTFTAIAVLQLAERKMIYLDDPVSKYIPVRLENNKLDSVPVTIRHLLTHTSGLIDSGRMEFIDKNKPVIIPFQQYPAGYRFYYSNLGYNLLGNIVGKISGKPVGRYISENILFPLGMSESIAAETMQGSGGLQCTLDDLAKYVIMLAGKGKYQDKTIISPVMFNEIFQETIESPPARFKEFRGIAWRVWTIDGRGYSMNHAALWENSGGWIQVFPSLRAGYVFMSDPPQYDQENFYVFYRGLKHRLLKLTGILSDLDLHPQSFNASVTTGPDLYHFAGIYRNKLTGMVFDVGVLPSGNLFALKTDTGEIFELYPVGKSNFVYIFPGQTEKGWAFDFVYRNGVLIGLAAMDGFYVRR